MWYGELLVQLGLQYQNELSCQKAASPTLVIGKVDGTWDVEAAQVAFHQQRL